MAYVKIETKKKEEKQLHDYKKGDVFTLDDGVEQSVYMLVNTDMNGYNAINLTTGSRWCGYSKRSVREVVSELLLAGMKEVRGAEITVRGEY